MLSRGRCVAWVDKFYIMHTWTQVTRAPLQLRAQHNLLFDMRCESHCMRQPSKSTLLCLKYRLIVSSKLCFLQLPNNIIANMNRYIIT